MSKLSNWIKLIGIFIICLLMSSENKNAYSVLEQSAAGVIGSILGGITAGVSVIFGILAIINKDNKKTSFGGYLNDLDIDLKILVYCLAASIFLPYLRNFDIPLISYPQHPLLPSKMKLISALELFVTIISLNIIIEVIECMILVVKKSLKNNDS